VEARHTHDILYFVIIVPRESHGVGRSQAATGWDRKKCPIDKSMYSTPEMFLDLRYAVWTAISHNQ